ncbi:MAG: hypothetical protein LBU22_12500 [Dysgonamonadaceae bacterium]|nr:hypothetical protein [Dysgonamonadaceae bacterium]
MLKFSAQFRLYRKFRYRKGYGVHSPFTYNLITKVIEEKTPYYVFNDIENFRKKLLSAENQLYKITASETQHQNYGALLFRLVNFFKCKNVLQIGGSTGVMSLYLALPLRNICDCYVLEERSGLLNALADYVNENHLQNLHLIRGDYTENLLKLKEKIAAFDLIFVNLSGEPDKMQHIIYEVGKLVNKNTLLIVDGITRSPEMKELWKKIVNHSKTRLTIDLLALGIAFFDEKLQKKHYKNYFNYGKKQNLHKKRRRRIHFVGRWEKSAKKQ